MYGHHPMQAQMGRYAFMNGTPQMGGIFDKLLEAAKKAGQGALDEAKSRALAEAAMAVVNEPSVQQAVAEQGEKAAYQQLIDYLYRTRQDITGYVSENPYTTMAIVGGGIAALVFLIYLMRR